MHRLTWLVAGSALLTLPALAQQRLDSARLFPVTSPVRHAGSVDVTTGRWTRGTKRAATSTIAIYNNTCTWIGGSYYDGYDWCEDVYDEGRIPSPSDPNAPVGSHSAYSVQSVQVSYCTHVGPLQGIGGYDMDLAFFDQLGGPCVGTVPPTPPPVSSTAAAYLPLAGLGLPGSSAFGFQACWLVTLDLSNAPFTLQGDGDGVHNGGFSDVFSWMQRQNTTVGPLSIPGKPDGFLRAGEPSSGGFGACTYAIPCGIDFISGEPCGTGLDIFDAFWVNVDGIGVGDSSHDAACPNAVSQYGFGTGCYFFPHYPGGPFNSHWLVLEAAFDPCSNGASCACTQSKRTSVPGCTALLSIPDPTLAPGLWSSTNIPRDASLGTGDVIGIYIYTNGVGDGPSTFSATTPFGTLCVNGFARSGPTVLVGAQGGFCNTGTMDLAPSSLIGPWLTVGEDVNVQLWYRDPQPSNSGNANFSNLAFYTVQ